MALPTILVKSPNDILNDLLRTIKAGLEDIGITNASVDPGTDYYILCQAIANEIAVAEQNILIASDSVMVDTASGTDLDRLLANYGLTRKSATVSTGYCCITTTYDTTINTGDLLTGPNGLSYKVTETGIYSNGDYIEVKSVDTGSSTELAVGSILVWNTTPIYSASTVSVVKAISGGVDSENDDSARSRLLSRMQNPPSYGNWQDIAETCEEADPIVEKAFVYPCANGPSTVHVAVSKSATKYDKSRTISTSKLSDINSYCQGQLPEYIESVITTVTDVPVDISFELSLPYPLGSVNLGLGGGWLDFQTFPGTNDMPDGYAKVLSLGSSSIYVSLSTTAVDPIINSSRISWINRVDYTVKTATIINFSSQIAGGYKNYIITTDRPFVGIADGDFIFPAMTNAQTYINAVLDHFSKLGPGEKITASSLLPRAYRKPRSNISYPNKIDDKMLKAVTESSIEVYDSNFLFRTYGANEPSLPTNIVNGPNIYIPRQIAFYPVN